MKGFWSLWEWATAMGKHRLTSIVTERMEAKTIIFNPPEMPKELAEERPAERNFFLETHLGEGGLWVHPTPWRDLQARMRASPNQGADTLLLYSWHMCSSKSSGSRSKHVDNYCKRALFRLFRFFLFFSISPLFLYFSFLCLSLRDA